MSKYFIDTEFHEHKKPTSILGIPVARTWTIDLISIGIVCDNGQEYYAINKDLNLKHANKDEWLRENVLDKLPSKHLDGMNVRGVRLWKPMAQIQKEIIAFVYDTSEIHNPHTIANWDEVKHQFPVEFYGYYADYDWVVFCWIFGRMIDLPKGFPMYCIDLKQMLDDRNLGKVWTKENCPEPPNEHNALADARWNKQLYDKIMEHDSAGYMAI